MSKLKSTVFTRHTCIGCGKKRYEKEMIRLPYLWRVNGRQGWICNNEDCQSIVITTGLIIDYSKFKIK